MPGYTYGRPIQEGSTSVSTYLRIIDNNGAPVTTVIPGAQLVIWGRFDTQVTNHINIPEVALASENAPWTSGGWIHIDDGYYRLDIPDAAWTLGQTGILFGGKADTGANEFVQGVYHHIVQYDPRNPVNLGLSALPNADAGAAGGLPLDTQVSSPAQVLAQVNAALAAYVMNAAALDAGTANKIADHLLRRAFGTAAASGDGDPKDFRSLLGAIAKLVNRIEIDLSDNLLIYEDDDSTVLGTQATTSQVSSSVITSLDTV